MRQKKEIDPKIGERVRTAREVAGLTQERLADMVGVSVQYLSDFERGVVGTSLNTLIRLCEVLLVSSDYLLFGRQEDATENCDVVHRLRFLPPEKLAIAERGINVLLEALNQK